jgi:hypothetical protein
MGETLASIGWTTPVIANQKTNRIIDGHMRVEEAAANGETVPVMWVHLNTEEEEHAALATLDPLALMATFDDQILTDLVEITDSVPSGVSDLLAQIANYDPVEELEEIAGRVPAPVADLPMPEVDLTSRGSEISVPNPAERRDAWAEAGVRSIILPFDADTYKLVVESFAEARERLGVDSNAEVVVSLLGVEQ